MTSDAQAKATAEGKENGKGKGKKPAGSLISFNSAMVIVAIVLFAQRVYRKMEAYKVPLKKEQWGRVNYTIAEIPTTHYSVGKVSEVLSGWDHSFRLYRIHENETFDFDINKFDSKVRAKALRDTCKWESALCTPCFDPNKKVTEVDTKRIFTESGWYASFAKIHDDVVAWLWGLMNLPFKVDVAELEHAFISNLKEPTITAGIHANPITSSMAIQFIGSKTWIFIPPSTYIGDMRATPAAPILLPKRAPTKPFELYVYHSQPGDILFFPESWAHIVLTHPGPGVMINYRNIYIMNILRQPLTWIAGRINGILSPVLYSTQEVADVAGNSMQQQYVPEKEFNSIAYEAMDKLCEGGSVTEFDQQMLELLKSEYARLHPQHA